MKKILSISVVALLAMAPTMGWAEEPSPVGASNQTSFNTTMNTNNLNSATNAQTYVTDRSSSNNANLTATSESGESYIKKGDDSVRPIVDPADPKYNVVPVTVNDGKHAAAVSYVKGAYNDLITKINKVSEGSEVDGILNVYTTWGGEDIEPIARVQKRYALSSSCVQECSGNTPTCVVDRTTSISTCMAALPTE